MRYSLDHHKLAQPTDTTLCRPQVVPREDTRPVSAPAPEDGTTGDLRRFAAGELESVTIAKRYEVRRVLGCGGMATVYEAYDRVLARPIALKVLNDMHTGEPRLLARFLSEARLTAKLRHPNIVEVLDFGTTRSGVVYLTMELLRGEDLRRKLAREGPLDWPRVRAWMLELCAGLEAAHAVGIVHRDLKPSNCFCVADGDEEHLRILDFGIATHVEAPTLEDGPRLTLADHIVGTPEYMSPEQVRGEPVDPRADVYAAGLVLGEMLTGNLPFEALTPTAMLAAHIYEPIVPLRELAPEHVHVAPALEAIYARALSKDPADRYPNIQSFAAALRCVDLDARRSVTTWLTDVLMRDEPPRHRPPRADARRRTGRSRRSRRSRREWPGYIAAASVAFAVGVCGALFFSAQSSPAAAPTGELLVDEAESLLSDGLWVATRASDALDLDPFERPSPADRSSPPSPQRRREIHKAPPLDRESLQTGRSARAEPSTLTRTDAPDEAEPPVHEPEEVAPSASSAPMLEVVDQPELLMPEPDTDAPPLLLD